MIKMISENDRLKTIELLYCNKWLRKNKDRIYCGSSKLTGTCGKLKNLTLNISLEIKVEVVPQWETFKEEWLLSTQLFLLIRDKMVVWKVCRMRILHAKLLQVRRQDKRSCIWNQAIGLKTSLRTNLLEKRLKKTCISMNYSSRLMK